MNPRTKRAAQTLFEWVGGASWLRNRFRGSIRILMYHRFPPGSRFEAQCAHLRKHYQPISLTDAVEQLKLGKEISGHPVVLTVDDGYRDFLENAVPVLDRYAIPATVFLTTDLPDRQGWLWVDRVAYCVRHSKHREVELGIGGGECWMLDTAERKRLAAESINSALKRLPNADRLKMLEKIPRVFDVDLPQTAPETHIPLSWDDVRALTKRGGIEFGAHTRSHPILSRLAGLAELEAEIAGSKQRIEEETGVAVRHFCYPNGTLEDISAETVDVTKSSGFSSAVIARRGVNRAGADLFHLRRIGVDSQDQLHAFALAVAGRRFV